jgi:hypothetical protein
MLAEVLARARPTEFGGAARPARLDLRRHALIYGAEGSGKYTFAIQTLSDLLAPRQLRQAQTMPLEAGGGAATGSNSRTRPQLELRASNAHVEIDFAFLGTFTSSGVSQRQLWHDICDELSGQQRVIVCRNLHLVHAEVVDTLPSYMRDLTFWFLSRDLSCVPPFDITVVRLVAPPRPAMGTSDGVARPAGTSDGVARHEAACLKLLRLLRRKDALRKWHNEVRVLMHDLFIFDFPVAECAWFLATRSAAADPQLAAAALLDLHRGTRCANRASLHVEYFISRFLT